MANAIYDGTSAIMLSGETAAGAYPVEAVRTMVRIAERTENDIDYVRQLEQWDVPVQKDVTSAISHATCTTAHDLGAVAIMTVSENRLYGAHDFEIPPGVPNHQRHDRPQGTEPDGPFLGRNPRDAGGKDQHRRAV